MRVLQIVEATGGGVARHVVDLCIGLSQNKVEVELIYSPVRMDPIFKQGLLLLERNGIRVTSIPMQRSLHPSDLAVLFSVAQHIRRRGKFDLIHGHSSKGGGIARLLRLGGIDSRVVYTPNSFVTLAPWLSISHRILFSLLETCLGRLTDALIVVSTLEYNEALRLGIPAKKLRIIPNGIRVGQVSAQDRNVLRKSLGIGEDEIVIGFVGRLDRQKNPLMLLRAFSQLSRKHPKTKLLVVGEGPLMGECVSYIRDQGLGNVIFTGYREGRVLLDAMDIFALSSDYEGFPYVLLEAMDAGLPIVATDVGGVRMAIEHGKK